MPREIAEANQVFMCGICRRIHDSRLNFKEAYPHGKSVLVKATQFGEGCSQWFFVSISNTRYIEIAQKLGLSYKIDELQL